MGVSRHKPRPNKHNQVAGTHINKHNEHNQRQEQTQTSEDEHKDKQMEGKVGAHIHRGWAYMQHQWGLQQQQQY